MPLTGSIVTSANPGPRRPAFRFERRPVDLPATVPFQTDADRVTIGRLRGRLFPTAMGSSSHLSWRRRPRPAFRALTRSGRPSEAPASPAVALTDPGTIVRPLFGGELVFAGCATGASASLGGMVAVRRTSATASTRPCSAISPRSSHPARRGPHRASATTWARTSSSAATAPSLLPARPPTVRRPIPPSATSSPSSSGMPRSRPRARSCGGTPVSRAARRRARLRGLRLVGRPGDLVGGRRGPRPAALPPGPARPRSTPRTWPSVTHHARGPRARRDRGHPGPLPRLLPGLAASASRPASTSFEPATAWRQLAAVHRHRTDGDRRHAGDALPLDGGTLDAVVSFTGIPRWRPPADERALAAARTAGHHAGPQPSVCRSRWPWRSWTPPATSTRRSVACPCRPSATSARSTAPGTARVLYLDPLVPPEPPAAQGHASTTAAGRRSTLPTRSTAPSSGGTAPTTRMASASTRAAAGSRSTAPSRTAPGNS